MGNVLNTNQKNGRSKRDELEEDEEQLEEEELEYEDGGDDDNQEAEEEPEEEEEQEEEQEEANVEDAADQVQQDEQDDGQEPEPEAEAATDDAKPTVCRKCREPLGDLFTVAGGFAYHPEHFTCASCHTPLSESAFYLVNKQATCASCYKSQYAKICDSCSQPILDAVTYSAENRHFHPACFSCSHCKTQLSPGERFYCELKGADPQSQKLSLFCRQCNFADRPVADQSECPTCGQMVSQGVFALGKHWHKRCFVCKRCNKQLHNANSCFEVDGHVYCRNNECVFAKSSVGSKRQTDSRAVRPTKKSKTTRSA